MTLYAVDVFSGSADSIVTDSHAQAVIIKATQGTGYVNPKCNHQWDLAGSNGKLRGLYHYAGGGNPTAEAQYFINNIRNYVGQAVLALDWESNQNSAWGNTNWARQFVNEVHRLTGVWPMIYVQESALSQVANCANNCALWVAKYASMNWGSWTLPNINVSSGAWSAITGWQFTGGDMDRDIFYLDANGWNKLANPGSTSGPTPTPDKPDDKPKEPVKVDTTKTYQQIILEPMTVDGIYGLGISKDNGVTKRIYYTVYGRKYYQEDATNLWKLLKPKIEALIDEKLRDGGENNSAR